MFRHAEDRLPIAIITLFFGADLAVYAFVDSIWLLAAWTLLGIIPKGYICAWNHHHQHVAVFKATPLNRLLELLYGLQTGATSMTWMLHHTIGHHSRYLDQETDESRWRHADGGTMGALHYTVMTALTAYPRALAVGRDYPKIRRTFVWMLALTLGVVALLVAARPLPGLFVFVLPMIISLLITTWATHAHHSDRSTASHFEASRNIVHRTYNILSGNLGYHTAHHYKPGVHWSKLPALHAKIADRIPDDCYLTPGIPFNLGQRHTASPERATEPQDASALEAPARPRLLGWLMRLLSPVAD